MTIKTNSKWLFLLIGIQFSSGCAEPPPTAQDIDKSLVGAWELERNETLKRQTKVLKQAGVLKVNQDVFEFNRTFEGTRFTFELLGNAEFSCFMSSGLESGEFFGHWETQGESISMVQTHEGKKPKKDVMKGSFDDNFIFLTHQQNGIDIPYVFRRSMENVE